MPKCAETPAKKVKISSSGWTNERRRKHAAAMRRWRPWEKSTGPRTADGKRRAAMNAVKHGNRSRAVGDFNKLLVNHNAMLQNLITAARLRRKYRYYAAPACRAALQKLILVRMLAGQGRIGANELLDYALRRYLIRFPARAAPALKHALANNGRHALSRAPWII